ncbi:hypothetical protein ZWY2020_023538 [Hordeum vulgare]|nr:hypothetical protein ZWY2020_023538 [Hordeum vulgare]
MDRRRYMTMDDALRVSRLRLDTSASPPCCAQDRTATAPTTTLKKMNHAAPELRHGQHQENPSAIDQILYRSICKFFVNGACFKGDYCQFSHDWNDQPNDEEIEADTTGAGAGEDEEEGEDGGEGDEEELEPTDDDERTPLETLW